MLTDVTIAVLDSWMAMVLAAVGGGANPTPAKIGTGQYRSTHWAFEHTVHEELEVYPQLPGELGAFGVCDSPEQFMAKVGHALEASDRKFCMSFVEVRKDQQPADGGWRWHKWGEYIGDGEPTMEYLHDEPKFERVFTYHVYELRR